MNVIKVPKRGIYKYMTWHFYALVIALISFTIGFVLKYSGPYAVYCYLIPVLMLWLPVVRKTEISNAEAMDFVGLYVLWPIMIFNDYYIISHEMQLDNSYKVPFMVLIALVVIICLSEHPPLDYEMIFEDEDKDKE